MATVSLLFVLSKNYEYKDYVEFKGLSFGAIKLKK